MSLFICIFLYVVVSPYSTIYLLVTMLLWLRFTNPIIYLLVTMLLWLRFTNPIIYLLVTMLL